MAKPARSNSGLDPDDIDDDDEPGERSYKVTASELRSFVERLERLEEEKKDIAEQSKEVMAEAKARGYDTKVLRMLLKERKADPQVLSETAAIMEVYREALGMGY